MLLRSDLVTHQGIAKEYTLNLIEDTQKVKDLSDTRQTNNTFVFTEQDLPGFKSKSRQKFEAATANMPARLTRPKTEKNKAPYDPNKKFTPFVRKPVPSKLNISIRNVALTSTQLERTVLAGRVKHEINAVEVDNEESRRLLELRTLESLRPKLSTKFLSKDASELGTGFILPGTMGAMKTFGNFIVKTSLLPPFSPTPF
jgi:transcription initiation factor TFIIF subunit beta